MATIKVFDTNGVKELHCFDTLSVIPYLVPLEEEIVSASEDTEAED